MRLSYTNPPIGFANSVRKPPAVFSAFPLMKELDVSGQFWLPDAIDVPLWGKLRYLPGQGVALTLDGKITGTSASPGILEIPEIRGQLFNGAPCVIENLHGYVETLWGPKKIFRSILRSELGLLGLDYSVEPRAFTASTLTLSHLNDWFDQPFSVDYSEKTDYADGVIRFRPDEPAVRAEFGGVPFELTVICGRSIPVAADSSGLEFTFTYKLVVRPDSAQDLRWHLQVSALTRQLFMLLIGSGIYTLDLGVEYADSPTGSEIRVLPRIGIPMVVRQDPVYFYTRHDQIRESFPDIFFTWFQEADRLSVIRSTLADLLTVDGTSAEAVFTRVVQTLEHFHGLIDSGDGRYVPKALWRRFTRWLRGEYPDCLPDATSEELRSLQAAKDALIGRIGGINSLSFRTRIRALFEAIPGKELMPILRNPPDVSKYLDESILRIEATRHYLTHFDPEQRELAFGHDELETPTLECWSVLMFHLASLLGMSSEAAGDLALAARDTMFLVGAELQL